VVIKGTFPISKNREVPRIKNREEGQKLLFTLFDFSKRQLVREGSSIPQSAIFLSRILLLMLAILLLVQLG